MNHRERFLTTFAHREPDRVPRHASLTKPLVEEFERRMGDQDYSVYWDCDFASVGFKAPEPLPDLISRFGHYFTDMDVEWHLSWDDRLYPPEWGVAQRYAHDFYAIGAPLSPLRNLTTIEQLNDYPFPDYMNEWGHDHLEAETERLHDDGYPVTASIGWIFQTAWTLRSEVGLFSDFFDNPDLAEALLDRILATRILQSQRVAEAGVDCVGMADDVGAQNSMILSPAMWRRWLKPRLAAVIQAARRANPDIIIRYHTDGYIVPIIPDLIEIGVSSLITVQEECMDVFDIKRRFGQDLVLEGTIGLQGELMLGTPEEVTSKIKAQCEGLMPGGGWVASPGNGVTPDIPFENLVAMFEALDRYGSYV
jgi:uroporphyrinogen decarboxylase